MLVSLYTSRVILRALGDVDFGIYNVVGGVIVLFTFINGSMTTATQRYLISTLGEGNDRKLTHVFSQAMLAHILIAIIIVLLGETIGLWIVENKLNIPEGRENTVFWVYQLSIFTAVLGIIRCPYNASIIAYEKMSFYAWLSIIESMLKLVVSFIILINISDRLILYSILLASVSLTTTLLYYFYCFKNFPEIRFKYRKDNKLLKEISLFSIWSLLGNASTVIVNQGAAVILNIFFGVVVNAALGIANQINAVAGSFVSNFQTAFMPQITKSYVNNDYVYLRNLILRTSRYSFLLLFIVSFPIYFNCEYILKLWLECVPSFTAELVRVIILGSIFDALSGPLWMSALARGGIRNYQIFISIISLLNLFLLYFAAKIGYNPVLAFGTKVIVLYLLYLYRLIYLDKVVSIKISQWFKLVYGRIILIITVSTGLSFVSSYISFSFLRLSVDCIIGLLLAYLIGLLPNERLKAISIVRNKLSISSER